MNLPDDLKYSKEHEWVRMDHDVATVGVTDYAQSQLGDIVYVDVETMGQTIDKDEVFGTIEAVKTVSDLFMPLSGEVIHVNHELEDSPELVNEDPYGKGWIIKIRLTHSGELQELLSAQDYKELTAE